MTASGRYLNGLLRGIGMIPYLYLAAGSFIGLFSGGAWSFAPAVWFAPVFFIRFFKKEKPLRAFLVGSLAAGLASAPGMHGIIPGGIAAETGTILLQSILSGAFFLANRQVTQKIQNFSATFFLPSLMAAFEFLNSEGSPFGSFGSTAYTQLTFGPFIQIVSLTGIYGIVFLIYWFGSVVNWAIDQRVQGESFLFGGIFYTTVNMAVLLFGLLRPTELQRNVQVSTLTPSRIEWDTTFQKALPYLSGSVDYTAFEKSEFRGLAKAIVNRLMQRSAIEAKSGSAFVLWAEGSAILDASDVPEFLNQAKDLAKAEHFYLIIAYVSIHPPRTLEENKLMENHALIIDPEGKILFDYLKSSPVPGFEENITRKGNGILPVVQTKTGRVSLAICFDADFPGAISQTGRGRTDILFIPGSDWKEISPIHTRMSYFRGIENGATVVRAAKLGTSGAADPFGRILGEKSDFESEDGTVLRTGISAQGVETLYPRTRDLFALLCGAVVMMECVTALYLVLIARQKQKAK